jgi:gamma-tubulin complex component 2
MTAWLLRDELTRQGVEGQLIRYDDGYDPLDELQRLRGAGWRVDVSLGQ